MDEGHEPERIEIELTSHEPARQRTTGGTTAGGGQTPSGHDGAVETAGRPGVLGTERGRLVAVAAAAGVIALVVGVLVGRLGSGELESAADPSSTTDVATTTSRPDGNRETLPRAPSVLTPTTTRPAPSTTTTIAPGRVVDGSIAINPVVTPEKVEVIALTRQGAVVRIDAITGATASMQTGARFGQAFVATVDDRVLVPDDRGGLAVFAEDGSSSSVDLGGWWPPLTSGDAAFWRAEFEQPSGQPFRLVETLLDGTETGAVIELDGFYPQMADPLGGVVVQAPGGYYSLTPDSRERMTVGQLHALGRRRALVHECDERLECGVFVVDRESGARERLQLDPEFETQLQAAGVAWWAFARPLSPDENALVVITFGHTGPMMGVLDLSSGSYTELGGFENEPQAAWGPAGRYLYWVDGGRIMVFDRSTGESVLFSEDLDPVAAVTVRPFGSPADAG